MTDLEKLWDDYPTGPAPTEAILRAARRREMVEESAVAAATATVRNAERRRRLVLRPLLTAGVATAVVGAFVAGSLLDDGAGDGTDAGPGEPGGVAPSNVAFAADLEPATNCDELLASYRERGLAQVTAWGWSAPYYSLAYHRGAWTTKAGGIIELSSNAAARDTALPQTTRSTSSDTGTNVQEEGVDEPDTVKVTDDLLVRVRGDDLLVHALGAGDRTAGALAELGRLDLPGIDDPEIMVAGDTVVAVGADRTASRRDPGTRVLSIDLADPARPTVVGDVAYDATAASVRQHGDTIRLVVDAGLPDLDFVHPGRKRGQKAALARNRRVVEESTITDWLPTITDAGSDGAGGADGAGGDPEQLLDCTDVALPPDEVGLDTVAVVGFDATDPASVEAIGLAGATSIAYESADHLYLVSSPGWTGCGPAIDCVVPVAPGAQRPAAPGGTSYVYDFALDGTRATHVASGEVEGDIRDRWSMDEAGGVLRVAVGPTADTGDFNSIVTLRREGEDLVEVGRLDRLGVREEIRSVRWFDDLAILVTFRQVDPFYAVDLSDLTAPRLVGELKIPGYSAYLHPLGSKRMIGIGEGPVDGPGGAWGAQIGLFDVTDLTAPRRLDVHSYGRWTGALAGTDPRAFTWVPEHRTVLTVTDRWRRTRVGYLQVTRIADGRLLTTSTRVEYGSDVALVRTVPLGDGRVVLVTGEEVRYLPLAAR